MRPSFAPALFLFALPAFGQDAPQPAPDHLLQALDLSSGWVQSLDLPLSPEVATVEVFLDGGVRVLHLAPHSVRADEFQLLVQGADGTIAPATPPPPATVRGIVAGFPESHVAGSLEGGRLTAVVRLRAGERPWGIHPAADLDPAAPAAEHVLYDAADVLPLPAVCGVPDVVGDVRPDQPTGADGGPTTEYAQIACDADVQYYQKNGSSVASTVADVENVINGCDGIYDSDFQIRYIIGTILVRTSEPDPYTTTSPSPLLGEFKTEWLANQGAIQRDVAHLFTGKNLAGSVIGIAYLNGICSFGSGYGLSQSKYTSSLTYRVALTAHELGHNWGANHCNGDSDCKIMCSGLGGCTGGVTSFGASASATILAKKAIASCLSGPPPTVAPVLTSATPSTTPAYQPGTIQVTGTGFEWATEVKLGNQVLPSPGGYFALDDSTLLLTIGAPDASGVSQLTVKNDVGTSNALPITFTESFPPKLNNLFWGFSTYSYDWKFGGEANDLWSLSVAVGDASTFSLFGYDFLTSGILVTFGTLDGAGVGSLQAVLPASAVGLSFFSQIGVIDDATGVFHSASNITSTFVII